MHTKLTKTTNCPRLWQVCPSKTVCSRGDYTYIHRGNTSFERARERLFFFFNIPISMFSSFENFVSFYHLHFLSLQLKSDPAKSVASCGLAAHPLYCKGKEMDRRHWQKLLAGPKHKIHPGFGKWTQGKEVNRPREGCCQEQAFFFFFF